MVSELVSQFFWFWFWNGFNFFLIWCECGFGFVIILFFEVVVVFDMKNHFKFSNGFRGCGGFDIKKFLNFQINLPKNKLRYEYCLIWDQKTENFHHWSGKIEKKCRNQKEPFHELVVIGYGYIWKLKWFLWLWFSPKNTTIWWFWFLQSNFFPNILVFCCCGFWNVQKEVEMVVVVVKTNWKQWLWRF